MYQRLLFAMRSCFLERRVGQLTYVEDIGALVVVAQRHVKLLLAFPRHFFADVSFDAVAYRW